MGLICLQCGGEGWANAFVDCVQCLKFSVHRYCLDKIPKTLDELVDWVCDRCEVTGERVHHAAQIQTRDTFRPEDIKRPYGVEEMANGVVPVRAEQIPMNILEQLHDSFDAIESNGDCPGSHLVEANEKDDTPLARGGENSEKTCELLGKEKSSEDILLKDIAKNQKKKRMFEERGNEKEHSILGGDKSDKQSHKKRKDGGTRDRAVISPMVKQSSDGRYKKRDSKKSYESADGSKKRKTGSSNKVVLQEERIEKGTARPIQHNVVPGLDNQPNDISDEVIEHGVYKDSAEKIIPALVQAREFATPTVNYGKDFLGDSENRTPQPIAIPIWSGSFRISNTDRSLCGLVAHLSDRACEKVYATASEFQPIIDFEIHPKSRVWPKSFEKVEPSGESIALYFFASETSANMFDQLVKDMIVKELALKAVLGDAELLIFTSTELPMQYWRFQHKYYLWGVFRGKQRSSHQTPG